MIGVICDVVAPRARGNGRSRVAALDVAAMRREAEESIRALACMVYGWWDVNKAIAKSVASAQVALS